MKRAERRAAWRNQRGITLIETIVALSLFAVTAATMSKFLVAQIRYASNNNLQTKAYSLAEDQLETIRSQRFNDMASSSKQVTMGAVKYTVASTVTDDTPANGLKSINVAVTWTDNTGPKSINVSTIYTEVRRF
ncbi:MAG: prepilin-type N-terminal cleavage/methylation domain-containing protein [Deltaproteobacteria bacterium]|nr:prepilin-type N-terminal cleavage/methylation domain-containing protein [Deltaproteobacteria bacterium]